MNFYLADPCTGKSVEVFDHLRSSGETLDEPSWKARGGGTDELEMEMFLLELAERYQIPDTLQARSR